MNINNFFQRLDELFAQKEMQQAEQYMKKSLAEAEDQKDFGSAIAICSELGGYCRVTSQYKEGIALYEKALHYIDQLGLTGSEHHGTTLMNYATTYTMTGDKEKALSLYKQAADIFQAAGFTIDYRLATLYNNICFIYQDLGQYDHAEKNLHKALAILKQLSESAIEQAITYANLANIYLASNRLPEAKTSAEKAISIFTKESGKEDVHYSAAVCTLGEIAFKENRFAAALSHFREAMSLTERDFGSNTLSYAVLCDNAALCCDALKLEKEAVAYRAEAQAIKERISL